MDAAGRQFQMDLKRDLFVPPGHAPTSGPYARAPMGGTGSPSFTRHKGLAAKAIVAKMKPGLFRPKGASDGGSEEMIREFSQSLARPSEIQRMLKRGR